MGQVRIVVIAYRWLSPFSKARGPPEFLGSDGESEKIIYKTKHNLLYFSRNVHIVVPNVCQITKLPTLTLLVLQL